MTKKEIVKQIADRAHLTQLKTKEIVQWTFDAIVDTLIRDGRIELRNFGVFEVKRRKPRKARNPRTGAKVDVEAKNVVTFKPGKEMEERVSRMTTIPTLHKTAARASEEEGTEMTTPAKAPTVGNGQEDYQVEETKLAPSPRPRKTAPAASTEVHS